MSITRVARTCNIVNFAQTAIQQILWRKIIKIRFPGGYEGLEKEPCAPVVPGPAHTWHIQGCLFMLLEGFYTVIPINLKSKELLLYRLQADYQIHI